MIDFCYVLMGGGGGGVSVYQTRMSRENDESGAQLWPLLIQLSGFTALIY